MISRKLFDRIPPIYLITDTGTAGITHAQMTRQALNAGIKVIQLRAKNMSKKDIYRDALKIRAITVKYNSLLIVNDHVDIALAVDADGVHLGQEDLPLAEARRIMGRKKIVGISTHTMGQAKKAEDSGADYIGFGPVFHTVTKDAGAPKGLKSLEKIRKQINIPIVAIGGITSENISGVLSAGADAAAVVSGILNGNIRANVGKYLSAAGPTIRRS